MQKPAAAKPDDSDDETVVYDEELLSASRLIERELMRTVLENIA